MLAVLRQSHIAGMSKFIQVQNSSNPVVLKRQLMGNRGVAAIWDCFIASSRARSRVLRYSRQKSGVFLIFNFFGMRSLL